MGVFFGVLLLALIHFSTGLGVRKGLSFRGKQNSISPNCNGTCDGMSGPCLSAPSYDCNSGRTLVLITFVEFLPICSNISYSTSWLVRK